LRLTNQKGLKAKMSDRNFSDLKKQVQALEDEFGDHAYLLYAMGLRLRTLDYDTLLRDNVLDGPDDKKVDFLHIDYESGIATIAQSAFRRSWDNRPPHANKAADLNTAISWLFHSNPKNIQRPEIAAAAEELRESVSLGFISTIEIMFIHNSTRDPNIEKELMSVYEYLILSLKQFQIDEASVAGRVIQSSIEIVDDWRRRLHESISIHDDVIFTSEFTPTVVTKNEWQMLVASVPALELIELKHKYGDELTSANIRDYLGSRTSARNINRQIRNSVIDEPENFLVYNNGVTLLTNRIEVRDEEFLLSGVSIINGAQTVGSLVESLVGSPEPDLSHAHVLVRAIRCNDKNVIERIVRFNNTQNPIKAWELRVIDPIQHKIKEKFEKELGVEYQLRRGLARRRSGAISIEHLVPFMCAFYGDPITAHRNKPELFESEKRYRSLFSDGSDVRNLLLINRLGQAVGQLKSSYKQKTDNGSATEIDQRKYRYFQYSAFQYGLIYSIEKVMEEIMKKSDQNFERKVRLSRNYQNNERKSMEVLEKLADVVLGGIDAYLQYKDAYQEIRSQAGVEAAANHARTIVSQISRMQPDNYKDIEAAIEA